MIEGWLAIAIAVISLAGVVMAYTYFRRTDDPASITLLPALIYVCVLYSFTVYIEFFQVWESEIRIYYRLAQLLQTFSIVMVLLSRILVDRKDS